MAPEPFWVSHSAMGDLDICEQRYYYHYVERLSPLERDVAPSIGDIVHDYKQTYYEHMRDRDVPGPLEAHTLATDAAVAKHTPKLEQYKAAAWTIGKDDLAKQFDIVIPQFNYMSKRWWELRGKQDWDEYEPLYVETPLRLKLVQGNRYVPSIWVSAKVDMAGIHVPTTRKVLWEHKNPFRVPEGGRRLRDVQTVIYVALLYTSSALEGNPFVTDEIIWDYILQTPPTVPDLLKSGLDKAERVIVGKRVSRDKRINTTWPVYYSTVVNNGDDPNLYPEMHELLKDAELEKFFLRLQVPQKVDMHYMVLNFINKAKRARDLRKAWASGKAIPDRVLNWQCDRCPYNKLCDTYLTGGDVEDTIDQFYKRPAEQQALPLDDKVPEPLPDAA